MDILKNKYNNDNYILIGENNEGNLLSLKSTNLSGNIDIYTDDTYLSLKVKNDSVIFYDNNTQNDITFDIHNQTISNTNSNIIDYSIHQDFAQATGNINPFNIQETNLWKSYTLFKFNVIDEALNSFTHIGSTTNTIVKDFYMLNNETKNSINGVGFIFTTLNSIDEYQIEYRDKISINSFTISDKENEAMISKPYKFGIYARVNNKYIQIYESTNGFIVNEELYVTRKNIYSTHFLFLIETIHLTHNDLSSIESISNRNSSVLLGYTNIESDFIVQLGLIKINVENKLNINTNIDFNYNSIGNLNQIQLNNIFLNGKLYNEILTYDDISTNTFTNLHTDTIHINNTSYSNNLITSENIINTTFNVLKMDKIILNGNEYTTLSEGGNSGNNGSGFDLTNYTSEFIFKSIFQPNNFNDIFGANNIIPYVLNGGTDNTISFLYNSNITTKHIEQLTNLSEGIIYINDVNNLEVKNEFSDIKIDNLISKEIITSNLNTNTLYTNTIDTEIITINSNILKWNPDTNQFEHGNYKLQNDIIDNISKFPPYLDNLENSVITQYSSTSLYYNAFSIDRFIIGKTFSDSNLTYSIKTNSDQTNCNISLDNIDKILNNRTFGFLNNYYQNNGLLRTDLNAFYYVTYNGIQTSDMIEFEFSEALLLKKCSFRLKESSSHPLHFYIFGLNNSNQWDIIFENTEQYDYTYYEDVIFNIETSNKYNRFSFAIKSVFNQTYGNCFLKNLRLYGYILDKNDHIFIPKSDRIEINQLYINNKTDLDDQINHNITKLIINPEFTSEYEMNTLSTIHINSIKHNNYDFNNLLRLSVLNPSEYSDNSLNSTHNSIVHQVGITDSATIYNIYVTDSVKDTLTDYDNLVLSMTKGRVGINMVPEVIEFNTDKKGLFLKDEIVFVNNNNISIRSSSNVNEEYTIELPSSKGIKDGFLKIENINNNILETKWETLSDTFLIDKNIYIGSSVNSNIHDKGYTLNENTTHISRLVIGSEEIPYNHIVNTYNLSVGGSIYATSDISTDSDISYKNNFEIIQNPIDKINQLHGYTFNRNDTLLNRRFTGLIAQEVEKVIPEAILEKHDKKLRVMYGNLIGLLVEGMKELSKEIEELKKK
tara:strand:+ start:11648 stop:14983 length:3336 start_codon:yes stop_codon:yes gene_type:complete